ncbi:hypothetical protein, partial [Nostoc sp.]|uniref:hypothetical protein n=1 Tax=Nostoc sp. TaxID=1180 RepID=UPI002FF87D79
SDVKAIGDSVKSDVKAIGDSVKSDVKAIGDSVKSDVKAIGDSIESDVKAIGDSVKSDVKAIGDSVESDVKGIGDSVKSDAKAIGDSVESDVKGIGDSVKSDVKAIGDSVESDVKGIGDSVKSDVKAIGDSVESNIKGVGNSVKTELETATRLAQTELSTATRLAQTELETSAKLAKTELETVGATSATNPALISTLAALTTASIVDQGLIGQLLGNEIQSNANINALAKSVTDLQNEIENKPDKPVQTSTITVQVFTGCDANNSPTYSTRTVSVIQGTEEAERLKFEQAAIADGATCKIGSGSGFANLLNEVRDIASSLMNATEQTINVVGKGFNALQDDGILSEGNWQYFPPNVSLKSGIIAQLATVAVAS